MTRRRFKKGGFYLTWREPFNKLTGNPTGGIPANKRATGGHFTESVYIPKHTRVMYVSRYKGPMVRVLYNDVLVQLHENFLIDDPTTQESK